MPGRRLSVAERWVCCAGTGLRSRSRRCCQAYDSPVTHEEAAVVGCCPVVELRQYSLHPGQRDVLIDLFDRELVESQESAGMHVIGQFRDLDRPDRFVWFRGFANMERRRDALEAFYGGPVWRAHSAAANATMIDSDDVLLLRPVVPSSGFPTLPPRPGLRQQAASSTFVATICSLDGPADVDALEQNLLPALAATTSPPLATFVEESSENTFPALPVRAGEHVVVWIQRTNGSGDDSAVVARNLVPGLAADPVQLRLGSTPRSGLR
jgi:hypothetical protein